MGAILKDDAPLADELQFCDEDIHKEFEGKAYVPGMPLMAQLSKQLRLASQTQDEKDRPNKEKQMTRATFVEKAQKDIWQHGVSVTRTHESGKAVGQTYQTHDTSRPRDKDDVLLVKKGESYWHWAFRFGGKHISKTQPKRSQLTQSEWRGRAYGLEEQMAEASASTPDDLSSLKDGWLQEIEEMYDEASGRLENMPDGLRENSSSGQTLQEYIDAFESWKDELDGIDTDIDEDELRREAENEIGEDDERVKDGADRPSLIEEKFAELLQEKVDEILSEMQSTSSGI